MPNVELVVGVAGGTGSGKTTVTSKIVGYFGDDVVCHIQHDWYYRDHSHLTPEERGQVNYDHPDELETSLLKEHISILTGGKSIESPRYDFSSHTRKRETLRLDPRPILVIDGILVLYDEDLRDRMNLKIFVDTADDVRFIRRLKRDLKERDRTVDSVIEQYEATVKPMHDMFVEPSKRHADLIIPEGGFNNEGVGICLEKIGSLLKATIMRQ